MYWITLSRLFVHRIFQCFVYWITLSRLYVHCIFQCFDRLEVESERNDVQKYPRGAYLEMEHHLLTLALVYPITASLKKIKLKIH